MTTNLIQIKNLSFSFQDKIIFKRININIPKGKIIALLGPSGTGKTTLLRLIGGQLQPTHGEVLIANKNLQKISYKELLALRQQIGMLFQHGALFTNLTVFENVAFPLREHTNLPQSLITTLVLLKLELVGLRGAANLTPHEISGGMARRVALARALALDPMLIMYDEPFTGLDPISLGIIVKLIRDIHNALNMTSIIVSHDVPEVMSIADYVYVISNGEIIGEGTPDILKYTNEAAVQQFIQGLPDGVVPFHYPAKTLIEDLESYV